MKVVVVGGSGMVGAMVLPELVSRHEVTVADRVPPRQDGVRFVEVDVRDHASADAAVAGQDAVVWLAMGPKQGWGEPDWALAQFDINTAGLYVVLQAAGRAGIRRAVLASTGSVFFDFTGRPPHATPDAVDAYGLSKTCGEVVAAAAARQYGMEVVALRLVGPMPVEEWELDQGQYQGALTAAPDVASAFAAALEKPVTPGLHTPWVSGDHTGEVVDVSGTRELLGWEPKLRRRTPPADR